MNKKLNIGDKVVCIDDFFVDHHSLYLHKGQVYTIINISENYGDQVSFYYQLNVTSTVFYDPRRFLAVAAYRAQKLQRILKNN